MNVVERKEPHPLNIQYFAKRLGFQISVIFLFAVVLKTVGSSVDNEREKALKTFYMTMCASGDNSGAEKHYKNMIKDGKLVDHPIRYAGRLSYASKGEITQTTPDEKILLRYDCQVLSKLVAKPL
jgi:hypothetical protein